MQYRTISTPRCELGEGPLWREDTGRFYWTDIEHGRIYAGTPSGEVSTVLETPWKTGAFLFAEDWSLLLLADTGVYLYPSQGLGFGPTVLLWKPDFAPGERFNDAVCDPAGRVLAGVKRADNRGGRLISWMPGEHPRTLLEDLQISNGMAFSPDCRTLYHNDSGTGIITAFAYNPATGSLSNPRPFFVAAGEGGVPDGITADAHGNIWAACWEGGRVIQISPAGDILQSIVLPASKTTSLTFGGAGYRTLFVTSAFIGAPESPGGECFVLEQMAQGRAEFRVKIGEIPLRL